MRTYCLLTSFFCLGAYALLTGCGGSSGNSGGGGNGGGGGSQAPTVTSISPTSVMAGSGNLALTVNGSGFLTTTTVQVGGIADPTAYVSGTQVTATVSASQLASGAQLAVIALNGSSSSGSGAPINLQVTNPSPTITSVAPSIELVGTLSPVIAVTGTGFVPTTQIQVNGSARTTDFTSATQVNVTLAAADVAATGSLSLTAVNGTPGGGTSAAATLAVNNPAPGPAIKLSPALVLTGATTATTVTVTGTNFVPASTVQVNGVAQATAYLSSTQVTFQVSAAETATAQVLPVSVLNPAPGGGSSLNAELEIFPQTPTPVITQVAPTQFYVQTGATTITVTGTSLFSQIDTSGFFEELFPTSTVLWNGTALTTQEFGIYGAPAAKLGFIIAAVPAGMLAAPGTATITVSSATSTPATSNAVTVTISNPPVPTLTSITPNSGLVNTATTVTLTGTGFAPDSTAAVNGTNIPTTYMSSTELSATIPASAVASPGTVNLTVTTPAPGGGTSAALPFTASYPPAPTLTSIYPAGGPINVAAQLTLNGTGFTPGSTVAVNGINVSSQFVSSTEMTATIPASAAVPGDLNVTVTTPPPGGGTSAAQVYTTFISIPNNDLVYNSADGLLYASVPASAAGAIGNSVVGIDPYTGTITRQIQVGTAPDKLALSTDGTQLFVGIDGAGAVAQINLAQGTIVNQFALGGGPGVYNAPYTAAYMAAVPGLPNSVAVATTGEYSNGSAVTIFDSGVARTGSSVSVGEGPLSFGSSASTLYLGSSYIYALTVGSTGITNSTELNSNSSSLSWLQYDDGSLYLSNGQVLNATTGALNGTFYTAANTPANGPVVSDSTLGRAFMAVSSFSSTAAVYIFDETSFNLLGSIPVGDLGTSGYPTSFRKIVRWGQNGIAVSAVPSAFTSNNQIFIFQSPLVKDVSSTPADLSVSLTAPATATTGTAISYVATATNAGPNAAVGATLSESLDPSLIINSVKASQGSCTTAAAFTCDLGSLADGASVTVTVNATPTNSGTLAAETSVSSSSFDPTLSNNQATASTTVTGSLYSAAPSVSSISPNLVQAGSAAFTLTVNGTGFNAGSTVNLGSTALATTYVSTTQLTAAVTAAEVVKYGWAPVTVTNPSPGGGVSAVLPLTVYDLVNVPANSILFDPFGQSLYATIPSNATGITGNSVAAVNPYTGAVGTPVAVGSQPTVMAETTDGNYLYIGLSGADSLAQFDLLTQDVTATIPLIYDSASTPALSVAAMPGTDSTLAIGISNGWDNFGIFDVSGSTGSFRTNLSGIYEGENPVFASPTELYAYDNQTSGAEFYRYSVNANGLTLIDGTTLDGMGGYGGLFQLSNGLVYGAGGGIINPATTPPSQVQTLPLIDFYGSGDVGGGVSVVADPSLEKDFLMLVNTAGTWAYGLVRYDLNTYLPEAVLDMPAAASGVESAWTMQRFGQDGLALLSSDNIGLTTPVVQLLLLRGPFIAPQELTTNSAASLTSSSAASLTHGAGNTVLTLTGSNFTPGVALTWNGNYRTTTRISPTEVTVSVPASDLANAGSGSLVATNPGAPASNTLTITIN